MPRATNSKKTSAFGQVQKQARALLASLRNEIRAKEADLRGLKDQESQLSALAGQRTGVVSKTPSGRPAGAGTRINWMTVLEQVPKQFKASDIRVIRGLKDKRPSEIFAAITRWIEAGIVKRKDRGVYERVK